MVLGKFEIVKRLSFAVHRLTFTDQQNRPPSTDQRTTTIEKRTKNNEQRTHE
jgi:hypothetical protein